MSSKRGRESGSGNDGQKKPKAAPETMNYAGYCLPRSDPAPIQRRAVLSLTPAEFFSEFVSARKPVVLTGAADLDPGGGARKGDRR
jgi:hypothetical protein